MILEGLLGCQVFNRRIMERDGLASDRIAIGADYHDAHVQSCDTKD